MSFLFLVLVVKMAAEGHLEPRHEIFESLDLEEPAVSDNHACDVNAASDDFYSEYAAASPKQQQQQVDTEKEEALKKNINQNETNIFCKICIMLITLIWLILSSFSLTGFVLAFTQKEIMFRVSFLLFNWFMTLTNFPPILRVILKALKLYHPQIDEFNYKCIYIAHRFMYVIFICVNIVNSTLLLNNTFFLACFFIGIYNIILAFRLGAYLSIRERGRFHLAHFGKLHI